MKKIINAPEQYTDDMLNVFTRRTPIWLNTLKMICAAIVLRRKSRARWQS